MWLLHPLKKIEKIQLQCRSKTFVIQNCRRIAREPKIVPKACMFRCSAEPHKMLVAVSRLSEPFGCLKQLKGMKAMLLIMM